MSEPSVRAPGRPRRWWLAVVVGAAPHIALLIYMAHPGDYGWFATEAASIPYTVFSRSELFIVPITLLIVIALGVPRSTRPWALWLLLGTLAGATAVLMTLAWEANAWSWETSDWGAPGPAFLVRV